MCRICSSQRLKRCVTLFLPTVFFLSHLSPGFLLSIYRFPLRKFVNIFEIQGAPPCQRRELKIEKNVEMKVRRKNSK
jgi:hypothetical protein